MLRLTHHDQLVAHLETQLGMLSNMLSLPTDVVSSYKSDMHVEIQILDKASIRSSW